MTNPGPTSAPRGDNDASTVAVFQDTWPLYRKMVDNNFLFHREAYAALRRFLIEELGRPFRFLDIACGDATSTAQALAGTPVRHFRGIDFSETALALAREALAPLGCPVALEKRDFQDLSLYGGDLVDVVWIGLSLHHLRQPDKARFMRHVLTLLADGGFLLVFENAGPDGEDRAQWMRRFDLQRPDWTAYSEAEWQAMAGHVHAADFPETDSGWRKLGSEAGFRTTRELYRTPTDLFRVYCFAR